MKRHLALAAAALAAFVFTVQAADAGSWDHHHRPVDKRIAAVALGVGAASTAAYFAINDWHWKWNNGTSLTVLSAWAATAMGCAAVSPMVATVVLKRPLTNREAGVLIGSCAVPVIGGWLVNEAYNAHPDWEPGYVAPPPHQHRHKKM